MCSFATTRARYVILDFDIVSEIITFEQKSRFGKEKHQNLGVKVKVVADMVNENINGNEKSRQDTRSKRSI